MLLPALMALDAQAATIWIPNASGVNDINYFYLYTPSGSNPDLSPLQFAIFDDTGDLNDSSAHLVINQAGTQGLFYNLYGLYSVSDTIQFSPEGNGDWTIQSTFTDVSMTLKDSNHFRVAWWDGSNWVSDAYFTDQRSGTSGNSGSNILYFNDNSLTVWLNQVDAVPSNNVPVPAAVYLLGAGLLTCIGLKKQKT